MHTETISNNIFPTQSTMSSIKEHKKEETQHTFNPLGQYSEALR